MSTAAGPTILGCVACCRSLTLLVAACRRLARGVVLLTAGKKVKDNASRETATTRRSWRRSAEADSHGDMLSCNWHYWRTTSARVIQSGCSTRKVSQKITYSNSQFSCSVLVSNACQSDVVGSGAFITMLPSLLCSSTCIHAPAGSELHLWPWITMHDRGRPLPNHLRQLVSPDPDGVSSSSMKIPAEECPA